MQTEDYVTFDPRIPKQYSYFNNVFLTAIIIMYIIEVLLNAYISEKALIILGAKWNTGITDGEYWRFLTPSLLHGNIIHLFLNFAALQIFGKELESLYGTFRYFILCILSSWGSILASYTFSNELAIGASGIVFGIIGGLIIFFYRQREKVTGANLRFKSMYTLVIINIILGFTIPRIDNSAHLGGLATGLLCGYFISPEYQIVKNEIENKLFVEKKKDITRVISGLFLLITILFWLTKISISHHLEV